MSLVECRRFPLLPQALVARSALEAAGLHPIVFDFWRASVFWTEQFALGGIRLMVPRQELEAARGLLSDLDPAPIARPPVLSGGPSLQASFLFVAALVVGWPIAGFGQPSRFHRVSALIMSVGIVLFYLLEFWWRWTL